MPFTEADCQKMGEIADATELNAMTELAGLLNDKDFHAKLLNTDNLESDRDFEQQLEDVLSHFSFLLDAIGLRKERHRQSRHKRETKGLA